MISRRALIRGAVGAATGSLALFGQLGTVTGRSTGSGDSSTPDGDGDSMTTTVTLSANETAIRAASRPAALAPLIEDVERQFDAVSLADVASITGTARVALDGIVDGTVVVTGTLAADAVRSELQTRAFTAAASRNGVDRYVRDDGVAVGVTDSTVIVGYGQEANRTRIQRRGLDRVDAVLAGGRRGPTQQDRNGAAAPLQSVLSGDITVTAALDDVTRNRLGATLADGPGSLGRVLGAADAVGTAASIRADGRTDLRHGLVAGPDRLSVERVRDVIREADTDADGIGDVTVERTGRVVVVDADIATENLLRAHLAAVGSGRPTEKRTSRQSIRDWLTGR